MYKSWDVKQGIKNVVQNFLSEVSDEQDLNADNKKVDENEEPNWKKYVGKKRQFTIKQICGR